MIALHTRILSTSLYGENWMTGLNKQGLPGQFLRSLMEVWETAIQREKMPYSKSIKAKLRIPPGRPSSQIHYMRVKPDICIDFPSLNGFGEAELQPTPDFDSIIFSGALKVGGRLQKTIRHVLKHLEDLGLVQGPQKASRKWNRGWIAKCGNTISTITQFWPGCRPPKGCREMVSHDHVLSMHDAILVPYLCLHRKPEKFSWTGHGKDSSGMFSVDVYLG